VGTTEARGKAGGVRDPSSPQGLRGGGALRMSESGSGLERILQSQACWRARGG
jgi:hypothetical protein